ncbi:myb transcription factor [Tieghemostelium lacteum]|uniref:Myb transcription factor n=1 Tax=Tieghemostelium lacteum TaxID=361077 RepID=A0A152A109_TIELA|nr:myb transcription factor [Tieghemostelium lacteum]|eukprot:KYQ99764.1 myb transcription factor [Tieghemostelium lacteum]
MMINPLVYPVSPSPNPYGYSQYCVPNNNTNPNSNGNSNNNSPTSSSNIGTSNIINNLTGSGSLTTQYTNSSLSQDVRVPENINLNSPSPPPRKRPLHSLSPPTPALLANSSYYPNTSSSHIVPQFSPQFQNTSNPINPLINSPIKMNIDLDSGTHIYNQFNPPQPPQQPIQHQQQQQLQQQQIQQTPQLQNNQQSLNSSSNFVESPPSMELMEDDYEDQLRDYMSPVVWSMMDNYGREQLYNAIVEYLSEEISFRNFLLELRVIAVMDVNYKTIFQFLVDLFVSMEPNQKMVNFLKDSGVEENELNIDLKSLELSNKDEPGQKKKRERVRKSVSRGLRNPPNKWTKEESQKLIQLVHEHGDKQWKKIAHQIAGGKTGAQCAQHWKRVLCPAIRKGSWDEDEESKLFQLVEKHGQSWKNVASEIKTRTDIQCRYQYFKSCMSREVPWSPREDEILQKKVMENKLDGRDINWMEVSKVMARGRQTKIPRTALECKARWEQLNFGGPGIQIIPHEELQQQLTPSLNSMILQNQTCF